MAKLFVLSGPSGVGKDTVLNEVLKNSYIKKTVSVTTRLPRVGEIDGVHYHFVSLEKFEEMIKNNDFLEYAKVHDNYYGTSKLQVEESLNNGEDVILAIDVQGGINVKKIMQDAILVFLLPPSFEELENRLSLRGTESIEAMELRLKNASWELSFADNYDYKIVNNTVENASNELKEIIEKG